MEKLVRLDCNHWHDWTDKEWQSLLETLGEKPLKVMVCPKCNRKGHVMDVLDGKEIKEG